MIADVTGGFDLCLELAGSFVDLQTEPFVAALLQPLEGLTLPLAVPTAGGPALAGTVRLLFSRAHVVPSGGFDDGRVTVTVISTLGLHFTAPRPDQFALPAELNLPALPVALSPPATRDAATGSAIVVNLTNATVTVTVSPGNLDDLDALAGRLGVAPDAITAAVAQTLTGAVGSLLAAAGPAGATRSIGGTTLEFSVPGQDGRLGPSAQSTFLTDAALATRAEAGVVSAAPAVLCLLGDLFDPPSPTGAPGAKTAVATGVDGAGAFAVTAAAVERFVFCPSIFRALLPTYLNQVLHSGVLSGIQPTDVPGYASLTAGQQAQIAAALTKHQVGYFFDLVLPQGLPPVSYRPALGETVFAQLPPDAQNMLTDTDAMMTAILPSQCGQAGGLPMPKSKLTAIQAGLSPDTITLGGVIAADAWGVGGEVKFTVTLFPRVGNGALKLIASPIKLDSNIYLEWYAVLIGAIIGAILGGLSAITGGATAIAEGVAVGAIAGTVFTLTAAQEVVAAFANNAVLYQLGQAVQKLSTALPLPTLGPAVATAVSVTSDGVTLQLGVPPATPDNPPLQEPIPVLTMTAAVNYNPTPAGSGVVKIESKCVNGTFAYQDYDIATVATFTAALTGLPLAPPVTFQWTVDDTPVTGPSGVIATIDPVYSLDYSLSADQTTLTLRNKPGGRSSYTRLVRCVATGSDGIGADGARGAYIVGFERNLDSSYQAQLAACLRGLSQQLGTLGLKPAPGFGGPVTGKDLADLIERLIPGGEWDPRAGDLIAAALCLTGAPGAGPALEALAVGGYAVPVLPGP